MNKNARLLTVRFNSRKCLCRMCYADGFRSGSVPSRLCTVVV